MEALNIAMLCLVIVGMAVLLSQFFLKRIASRNQTVNNKAEQRALRKEEQYLEDLRYAPFTNAMDNNHALSDKTIIALYRLMDEILNHKAALIYRYGKKVIKASMEPLGHRKPIMEGLKKDIDRALIHDNLAFDELRKVHRIVAEDKIYHQMLKHNQRLENKYKHYCALSEKIHLRHAHYSELDKRFSDVKLDTFSTFDLSEEKAEQENQAREDVTRIQQDIGYVGFLTPNEARVPL